MQLSETVMQLATRHPTAHVTELISMAQELTQQQQQQARFGGQAQGGYSAPAGVPPGAQMWGMLTAEQRSKLANLTEGQRAQVCAESLPFALQRGPLCQMKRHQSVCIFCVESRKCQSSIRHTNHLIDG